MISINNVTLKYSDNTILNDITFVINPKDKIGLIGNNGAGKTSLLRLLCGELSPNSGSIIIPSNYKIGYLPQQMNTSDRLSVYDEAYSIFSDVINFQKEIDNINEQLLHRIDYDSKEYNDLLNRLSDLYDKINLSNADKINSQIEITLQGLGFDKSEFNRPTSQLSGGWRMRVELAKILLQNPNLILLDEPTNHLDIESIQWLDNFLKQSDASLILVSHDRRFLDNVTNRTIEISKGKIYYYKVGYSKYLTQRTERLDSQIKAYNNQQKYIADTERFIEDYKGITSKSRQIKSRQKMLEKLEIIEVEEFDKRKIHFRFPIAPKSGRLVIEAEKIKRNYGDKHVLKGIDLTVEAGEKIAFVGKNGEGKTTFTRILVGEDKQFSGNLTLGTNISLGYLAQNQDEILDNDRTVFETLDLVAINETRTEIRNILASFLFSGDDIHKKVGVLSGGERNRLALAKLLCYQHNLLILDEPTNHLDMNSKEILKKALMDYSGTLIVVSHDRDFLDGLVDKLYEFKNGKIKEYIGSITEFLNTKILGQ